MLSLFKKLVRIPKFQIGALALAFGVGVLWVEWHNYHDYFSFSQLVFWVEQARFNGWSALIFYACFILAVLGLPITLFPIIGGVLFPFWIALPLNLAAATIGSWIAFFIARCFGRQKIEPFLKGRMRSFDRVTGLQGFKTVLLLRFIGVPPFAIVNYALGFSRIRSRDFIFGTMTGLIPWMAFVTYLAGSLWQAVLVGGEKGFSSALFSSMRPLLLVSMTVMATTFVNFYLKRRRKLSWTYVSI